MANIIDEKQRVLQLIAHMDSALRANDYERAEAYFKLVDKHMATLLKISGQK